MFKVGPLAKDKPMRRFFLVAVANIVAAAAGLALFTLMARSQGPVELGHMALALSFMVYGLILSNFGTDSIAIRTVSRDPESASGVVGVVIAFRLVTNIPVIFLGTMLALAYAGSTIPGLMAILVLSLTIGAIAPAWLAPATERSDVLGAYNIMSPVVTFLTAVSFLNLGWPHGIYAFAVARVVGDLIAASGLLWWAMKVTGKIDRPNFNEILKLGRKAGPIGLSRVISGLGQAADLFIVSIFVSKHDTGIYAASLRIYLLMLSMSLLYSGVIFPAFARAAKDGVQSVVRHLHGALKATIPLAVSAMLLIILLAPSLLHVAFGTEFAGSALILRLFCVSALLNFTSVMIGTALLATGQFRDFMQATIFSTIILVVAKIIFTACFGIIGAAVATSLGEGAMIAFQWRLLRRVGKSGSLMKPSV